MGIIFVLSSSSRFLFSEIKKEKTKQKKGLLIYRLNLQKVDIHVVDIIELVDWLASWLLSLVG